MNRYYINSSAIMIGKVDNPVFNDNVLEFTDKTVIDHSWSLNVTRYQQSIGIYSLPAIGKVKCDFPMLNLNSVH